MPATLGHIGVQYLATKGLIRGADTKWILLGSIIPDLPWIMQRLADGLTDLSPFTVRLYAIGQSSLAISLILCIGLACFSWTFWRTGATLALGVLLHLLLDATQIKWGNGVVLFAPFRWDTFRFDLFWPEDPASYVLFALGIVVVLWIVLKDRATSAGLILPRGWVGAFCGLSILTYLALPFATMPAIRTADLHYVGTLQDVSARAGKSVEIDRNVLHVATDGPILRGWFGDSISLSGNLPAQDEKISVQGIFTAPRNLKVTKYHVHDARGLREYASLLGLAFVALWWLRVFLQRKLR